MISVHTCTFAVVVSVHFRKLKTEISAGLCPTSLLHFVAHMQRVELKMVLDILCFVGCNYWWSKDFGDSTYSRYGVFVAHLIGHWTCDWTVAWQPCAPVIKHFFSSIVWYWCKNRLTWQLTHAYCHVALHWYVTESDAGWISLRLSQLETMKDALYGSHRGCRHCIQEY